MVERWMPIRQNCSYAESRSRVRISSLSSTTPTFDLRAPAAGGDSTLAPCDQGHIVILSEIQRFTLCISISLTRRRGMTMDGLGLSRRDALRAGGGLLGAAGA